VVVGHDEPKGLLEQRVPGEARGLRAGEEQVGAAAVDDVDEAMRA
jgi:hypothetical protein